MRTKKPFSMLAPGETIITTPGGNKMIVPSFFTEPTTTAQDIINWMFKTHPEQIRKSLEKLQRLQNETSST